MNIIRESIATALTIVVSAFFPLFTDETISVNTTFDADRVIDGVLTIGNGVTINLARGGGHDYELPAGWR